MHHHDSLAIVPYTSFLAALFVLAEELHEAAAAKAGTQCGSLLSRDSCLSISVTSQRCTVSWELPVLTDAGVCS